MNNSHTFCSIIIPTLNDSAKLYLCLEALKHQTYPKSSYEIIIVDNGSEEKVSESFLERYSDMNLILLDEPRQGSYVARNSGIRSSRGSIVAFTDADCIPHEDWIEKGIDRLLNTKGSGIVGGKILISYENAKEPNAVEIYEKLSAFQQRTYIEKGKFSVTANLFTFKEVFEKVGLFSDQLISSGDKEWGKRVYRAGYQLSYAEDVCVKHPARRSLLSLRIKILRVAYGLHQLSKIEKYEENNKIRYKIKQFMQVFIDISRTAEFINKVLYTSEIKGFQKRLVISLLACYVRCLRISEALRLELGLPPRVTR